MKKSFRDYYSWTLSDFFNELKRIGYGSDSLCNRHAIYWQRQSSNLFTRDYRKKYFTEESLNTSLMYHKKIFTSCDYSNYNYKGNPSIYNRRHIEPFWNRSHINYFLRYKKK